MLAADPSLASCGVAAIRASTRPAVRYNRLSTANVRTTISPILCLIAPNDAIGWPNCRRWAA